MFPILPTNFYREFTEPQLNIRRVRYSRRRNLLVEMKDRSISDQRIFKSFPVWTTNFSHFMRQYWRDIRRSQSYCCIEEGFLLMFRRIGVSRWLWRYVDRPYSTVGDLQRVHHFGQCKRPPAGARAKKTTFRLFRGAPNKLPLREVQGIPSNYEPSACPRAIEAPPH